MQFYFDESAVLNKEIVKFVNLIKNRIDKDFEPYPVAEYNDNGEEVLVFVSGDTNIELPLELASVSGDLLSNAQALIIRIMARGNEVLCDYQTRLDLLDVTSTNYKSEILSNSASEGKKKTATELKALASSDTTAQIYNSTTVLYKSGIRFIQARLRSYEQMMFAISDELKGRRKGFQD